MMKPRLNHGKHQWHRSACASVFSATWIGLSLVSRLDISSKQLLHVALQTIVMFLNFRMPENFAVNYLKFKQRGQTLGYFIKKDAI